jgi:NADH:ubiquinone oxidoreductase subunit
MARIIQAIKQLFGSNTREPFVKLIGTDRFQNKFYERLPGNRYYKSTRRFYEPADYADVHLHIDPAWEGSFQ